MPQTEETNPQILPSQTNECKFYSVCDKTKICEAWERNSQGCAPRGFTIRKIVDVDVSFASSTKAYTPN